MSTQDAKTKLLEPLTEALNSMSRLKRLSLCVLLFALPIAAFVWFSYLPAKAKLEKQRKELERRKSRLALLVKKASQLERFRKEVKEAEDAFKLAMQALPDRKEIPSLLNSISRSGYEAGLVFLSFEPKPETRRDFYAAIPVEMKMMGKYHQVGQFLQNIANLPRIVNIEGMTLSPEKNAPQLITACTAVTYKFVDAPLPEPSPAAGAKKKKG